MDNKHHEDANNGCQDSGGDVIHQGSRSHSPWGSGVQLRHPYRVMERWEGNEDLQEGGGMNTEKNIAEVLLKCGGEKYLLAPWNHNYCQWALKS
jgi:hypothetical protein